MLVNEKDMLIYKEELEPRLPRRILDVHVHAWGKESLPPGYVFPPRNCSGRFGSEFTIAMFHGMMKELLPSQEVSLNCFGMPSEISNRDIAPAGALPGDTVNILISPDDSAEIVEERIVRSGAVGVKPYWNYAAAVFHKASREVEIHDMLSKEQLEMLNRRKLAVTLHIPRPGRFEDSVNQRQMIELCENYPNIQFIFAHIGRAYFMQNIRKSNLDEFVKYPNAWFDTAMLNHEGVFQYTFDHFPVERILFGSDSPIALLRGKSVEINNQYAYLMAEDYEIGTSIRDTAHAVDFTFFYYEQLRALLNTIPAGHCEDVFFNNATNLFKGTGR